MPEDFLQLNPVEQSQIYRALAPQLARSPVVLEKDVWVCWTLKTLFTMPDRLPMAFKGGTSLSKVFGAINRFSEDVDITLDYRALGDAFDPFVPDISHTRLKKFGDALKSFVRDHAHSVVAPYFQKQLAAQFRFDKSQAEAYRLELSDDGEQMRVYYPSVLEAAGGYVSTSVLIEFGGRNITEPSEEHDVQPDIATHVNGLEFPRSRVRVLSPARTFWEKATLMHVECQRNEFRTSTARLSRHWYDLAMLADLAYGHTAVADCALLANVVKHKKAFYNAAYANYDACLNGHFRLIPVVAGLAALREGYQRMIDAGMFIGEPFSFDLIVDRLHRLETTINAMFRAA